MLKLIKKLIESLFIEVTQESAFSQGFDAAISGDQVACPWGPGTLERRMWLEGYKRGCDASALSFKEVGRGTIEIEDHS